MALKVYFDHMSQPSRAVIAFCRFANIQHQPVEIRLNRKANLNPEFKKVNPFQKVPVIDDNGFLLHESHAILPYLAQKFNAKDHFYPKDLQKRAQIDCLLHWHHQNTRLCSRLFQIAFSSAFHHPVNFVKEIEEKNVEKALNELNENFLKGGKYLCGQNEMSIADISLACEISQMSMFDYDLSGHKDISKWLDHMLSFKEMKEAHETFFKLSAMAKSKKDKK